MEWNSNDNYVLVLEDRTEVKNEKEAGKLSIASHLREIAYPWDDHQKKKHFHDVCLNTFA